MLKRLPRGVLVVFEGIDGAGKTTQSERLAVRLRADGWDVVRSKEPTNGPWGQRLRQSAEHGRMSAADELAAFLADRLEHVEQVIEPALVAGQVVIVDRYYFSTAAYQGAREGGGDPAEILRLNEAFAPQPDLLVLLRVPVETGLARIATRGDRANLFEQAEALARSAAIFDGIERPYALRVDGTFAIDAISDAVLEHVYRAIVDARGSDSDERIPAADAHAFLDEVQLIERDPSVPVEDKALAVVHVARRFAQAKT